MAYGTYTLADLVNAVQHSIGGSPDSETSETQIVNDALHQLAYARAWTWRQRIKPLDITAYAITSMARSSNVVTVTRTAHGMAVGDWFRVSGSSAATNGFNGSFYVASVPTANTFTFAQNGADETATTAGSFIPGWLALPSDFDQIESVRAGRTSLGVQSVGTVDVLGAMRVSDTSVGDTHICWALGSAPQSGVTATPTYRLEIHPVPTAATQSYLLLSYLRLIPDLANTTDVPDIGIDAHRVLLEFCRALAKTREMPANPETDPTWKHAWMQYQTLAESDGRRLGVSGVKPRPGLILHEDRRGGIPSWMPATGLSV